MDYLYAWVEDGPDGLEGVILATVLPGFGPTAMVSRSADVAGSPVWETLARLHRQASGHPVRLRRFRDDGVIVELP